MAENSKIQWTTHTWNPWRGCTKVSPGCQHCYAETMAGRNPKTLGVWGPNGTRVVLAEKGWLEPVRWNAEAAADGEPVRVFCASLADVFEDWSGPMVDHYGERLFYPNNSWQDRRKWISAPECGGDEVPITMDTVRLRLFALIAMTPYLEWLLLTKRPENIAPTLARLRGMGLVASDHFPWGNVRLGFTAEDQPNYDRRLKAMDPLMRAGWKTFVSAEPLLGPLDLMLDHECGDPPHPGPCPPNPGWVIVGGESGHGSRPMHVGWVRGVVRQCEAAGVPVFVKQLGANYADEKNGVCGHSTRWPLDVLPAGPFKRLADPKGGDIEEFPSDLRVRQFPAPAEAR